MLITLISSTNYTNVSNYTNLGLEQLVVNSFNSWIKLVVNSFNSWIKLVDCLTL